MTIPSKKNTSLQHLQFFVGLSLWFKLDMNESDEIRSRIRLARIISSCLRMEERRSEEYYERNLPEQGFIFFKKSQASSSSFSSSLRISRFIIFLSLRSILLKRDFDVCYEYRFGLLRVTTTEARDSRGIQADNTKGQGKMLDEKSSHTKSKLLKVSWNNERYSTTCWMDPKSGLICMDLLEWTRSALLEIFLLLVFIISIRASLKKSKNFSFLIWDFSFFLIY